MPQTFIIILYDTSIGGKAPRKKSFISETNRVKNLDLQNLMSTNHRNFEKMLFFQMRASSIFLVHGVRKLYGESQILLFKYENNLILISVTPVT